MCPWGGVSSWIGRYVHRKGGVSMARKVCPLGWRCVNGERGVSMGEVCLWGRGCVYGEGGVSMGREVHA